MAKYNEILTGRHNRFLQKLFSMKGGPPAPQLSGDIQVGQALFHGAENRFIESWNRFASGISQPALAAQDSATIFRNPKTSGVIAVIERLSFSESVADATLLISQDTLSTVLTNANAARCLDNRPVKAAASTLGAACQLSSGNAFAATGGLLFRINIAANQEIFLISTENQEITVLPGDQIELVTGQVNTVLQSSWMWRERVLEDSEAF